MKEWTPVPGYEGLYEISAQGQVRGLKRGTILRAFPDRDGYFRVRLSKNGVVTNLMSHRLVCEAFHGPAPEGKPWALHGPLGNQVNTPENLRWGSAQDNARDRSRDGNDQKANQTECRRGHPFSGDNTRVRSNGTRACITCHNIRAMKSYYRMRETTND